MPHIMKTRQRPCVRCRIWCPFVHAWFIVNLKCCYVLCPNSEVRLSCNLLSRFNRLVYNTLLLNALLPSATASCCWSCDDVPGKHATCSCKANKDLPPFSMKSMRSGTVVLYGSVVWSWRLFLRTCQSNWSAFLAETCICAKTRRFCPFFGNTNGCAMSEGNPVHLPAAERKTGRLWKHHPYQNDANHLQPIDQLGQSPPLQDHLDGVPWWAHHACSSCSTWWVRSRASVTFWGVAIEDGFRRHPWTKP